LLVLGSMGCSSDESNSHAPFCTDPACVSTLRPTVGTSSGGADSTGDTTNVSGAGTTVSIEGQIVAVSEGTFAVSSASLSSTFVVQAPTAGGTVLESTVASTFSFEGVVRSRTAWLAAKPSSASDLMPGLVGFDSTSQQSVVIPLIRKTSLDLVANSLSSMTTLDSSTAQIVLRFVDTNGKAVRGVKAAVTGATVVAYDYLGSYSNDVDSTGTSGLAFLFNIPASAVPLTTTLNLSGAVTAEYSLWVEAGAATFAEFLVSSSS